MIENLLQNAIKYGAENGPVTVSLEKREGWVRLSVHNTGNPIEEEQRKNLFDPYARGPDAASGSQLGWGLGLTLVQGMVEAHEGSIHVESSLEKGTTFTIELQDLGLQESSDLGLTTARHAPSKVEKRLS